MLGAYYSIKVTGKPSFFHFSSTPGATASTYSSPPKTFEAYVEDNNSKKIRLS